MPVVSTCQSVWRCPRWSAISSAPSVAPGTAPLIIRYGLGLMRECPVRPANIPTTPRVEPVCHNWRNPPCCVRVTRSQGRESGPHGGTTMSRNTLDIYCPNCRVSDPRDLSELGRPSGRTCLLCCWRLPAESVWSAYCTWDLGQAECDRPNIPTTTKTELGVTKP